MRAFFGATVRYSLGFWRLHGIHFISCGTDRVLGARSERSACRFRPPAPNQNLNGVDRTAHSVSNINIIPDKYHIWLALAELFFLDAEPGDADFERVAKLLKAASWGKEDALSALMAIAPTAGANLGYLIYPAIGEWAGFDKQSLCGKIERSLALRQKYPKWYFYLQDKYSGWMLKKLKAGLLLDLLQ